MQPEFSPTSRSAEQTPDNTGYSYEIPPNYAAPEMEPVGFERGVERSPIELAPQAPQQPLPVAQPMQMPVAMSTVVPVDDTQSLNPVSANDDDMIEKEWVDRAKQVLVQTKDDPYQREKAIGALQRDYLMKRYGKQLGATED